MSSEVMAVLIVLMVFLPCARRLPWGLCCLGILYSLIPAFTYLRYNYSLIWRNVIILYSMWFLATTSCDRNVLTLQCVFVVHYSNVVLYRVINISFSITYLFDCLWVYKIYGNSNSGYVCYFKNISFVVILCCILSVVIKVLLIL